MASSESRRPQPLTLRVQRAILESSMPKDARHVVHVLAVLSNSTTGVGWHGQATIAAAGALSERHVRGIMAELERRQDWPVRLVRRRRGGPGGVGRTSDEWRLELVPQPARPAGSYEPQPAHGAASEGGEPVTPTGTPRQANRHATTAEPAHGAGDLRSDRRSDRRSTSSAPTATDNFALTSGVPKPVRKTKAKPKGPEGYGETIACYSEEYERVRGVKPVITNRTGKAAKDLLAAMPLADVCGVIRRAFADDWFQKNQGELHEIAGSANKWRGAPPKNGKGKYHRQPSRGNVDPEEYMADV